MLDWLYNWLESFVDWILSLIISITEWAYDLIQWALDWLAYQLWVVWDSVLSALQSLITSIPKPAFYTQVEGYICSYFAQFTGLIASVDISGPITLIFVGYALRFVIRRIPVIG